MVRLVLVPRLVWRLLRVLAIGMARFAKALWRTRAWGLACLGVWLAWAIVHIDNTSRVPFVVFLSTWLGPLLCGVVWSLAWPVSFERIVGWRWRRHQWRRFMKRNWDAWARECNLSVQREANRRVRVKYRDHDGRPAYRYEQQLVPVWVGPKLRRVDLDGTLLSLTASVRLGQTVDELVDATARIGTAAGARSWRCEVHDTVQVTYRLMLGEVLQAASTAVFPVQATPDSVVMGRMEDGSAWVLPVVGRHTLVAGCSGAGKGSMLWGICGGLAPCVAEGTVQLWGIDLKRGVEISMGRDLFSCLAINSTQAITILTELLHVIDKRGNRMAGVSRLHQPKPGDPLHVLVIDELAALTAYAEPEVRREANRLLSEILTQGRALGVVVVACVQDPRKEVVGMRGLFTQTIALRLRSAEETRMVLGDGMADLAPAHKINPLHQGMAWIVDDEGAVNRVRADYWPDPLIRQVASNYPAPRQVAMPTTPAAQTAATVIPGQVIDPDAEPTVTDLPTRKPRKPRAPRQPRAARPATAEAGDARVHLDGDAA